MIVDISSQQTPVVYAASAIDVTKEIIDLYDKNVPAAGAAPTSAAPAAPRPAPPSVTPPKAAPGAATPAPKPPAPKPGTPK
ncbi:MAG: hypothetical protein HYZ57_09380 [Acidobacteria bacterium]|nr:hypothetical protein [Acidobacteriota bacterium]